MGLWGKKNGAKIRGLGCNCTQNTQVALSASTFITPKENAAPNYSNSSNMFKLHQIIDSFRYSTKNLGSLSGYFYWRQKVKDWTGLNYPSKVDLETFKPVSCLDRLSTWPFLCQRKAMAVGTTGSDFAQSKLALSGSSSMAENGLTYVDPLQMQQDRCKISKHWSTCSFFST